MGQEIEPVQVGSPKNEKGPDFVAKIKRAGWSEMGRPSQEGSTNS